MSRHRNVRSMDYNDEYDGYDDVYGHSVEDDYCISPSDAAQFMYDRTRQPQMSAFFSEEDNIAEEDETGDDIGEPHKARHSSESYRRPVLNELDEAKLRSCLEKIRDVIGDSVPEHVLVETILQCNFNADQALDKVLTTVSAASENSCTDAPKPQRTRKERDRDDDFICSEYNLFDVSRDSDVNCLKEGVEKLKLCNSVECPTLNIADNVEECDSDFDDFLDGLISKSNPPFFKESVNKTIPENFFPNSSTQNEVQMIAIHAPLNAISDRLFEDRTDPLKSREKKKNVAKVERINCETDESILNIPKLLIKTRKDSDKENVENVSPDSSEVSFSSPLQSFQKSMSEKQSESKEESHSILSCKKPLLSNDIVSHKSPVASSTNQTDGSSCSDTDEEMEFSPLALLANQFAKLSNKPSWRKKVMCSTCHNGSDEESEILNKPSTNRDSSKQIISLPPRPAFHKETRDVQNVATFSDEESDDEMVNVSPLLAFASQRNILQDTTKNHVISEPIIVPITSEKSLNKFDCELCMDSDNERTSFSDASDVVSLSYAMSDNLNISPDTNTEDGQVSSLSTLISRHAVVPSEEPLSSLSDLAANHLIRSSSCWKVKADGETMSRKSLSLTDSSISKSVPGRFFIPSLGSTSCNNTPSESMLRLSGMTAQKDGNSSEDEGDWVFDLSSALQKPNTGGPSEVMEVSSMPEIIPIIVNIAVMECVLDARNVMKMKLGHTKKKCTSFGKTLCRKWRDLALPYIPPKKQIALPFNFNTASPDDEIQNCRSKTRRLRVIEDSSVLDVKRL